MIVASRPLQVSASGLKKESEDHHVNVLQDDEPSKYFLLGQHMGHEPEITGASHEAPAVLRSCEPQVGPANHRDKVRLAMQFALLAPLLICTPAHCKPILPATP